MAEPTGFEPATSDVTGRSVSRLFAVNHMRCSKLNELGQSLSVTARHGHASFTGTPTGTECDVDLAHTAFYEKQTVILRDWNITSHFTIHQRNWLLRKSHTPQQVRVPWIATERLEG